MSIFLINVDLQYSQTFTTSTWVLVLIGVIIKNRSKLHKDL